ncbi:hypothetical protein DRP04_05360 [Archaeoglobales archaeon]|nr:MAG: hypothetical protein DRP04_05360 [Archaeoglobales archaeon]
MPRPLEEIVTEAVRKVLHKYGWLTTSQVKRILEREYEIKCHEDTVRKYLKKLVAKGELEEEERMTEKGPRHGYRLKTKQKVRVKFIVRNPEIKNISMNEKNLIIDVAGENLRGVIQTHGSYVQVGSATITPKGDIVSTNIVTPTGATSIVIQTTIHGGPYCPKCGSPVLESGDCPHCSGYCYYPEW